MAVAHHVVPADRVLAAIGEGLRSCGTEELQEGQLDHRNRIPISVNIGELKQKGIMGKELSLSLVKDSSLDTLIAWHPYKRAHPS